MHVISNQQISELITTAEAIEAMREAFASAGEGAHQGRVRTSASNGVALATMGAVIPAAGLAYRKACIKYGW